MFSTNDIDFIATFFDIEKNTEDTLLILQSKSSDHKWLIIDYGEKFDTRLGIYLKNNKEKFLHHKDTTDLKHFIKIASDSEK